MKLTDIQEKWLQALESGAYKQTFGMLRQRNCFCCLGVVCDVVDPTKWIQKVNQSYCYINNNINSSLSTDLINQLQLRSGCGDIRMLDENGFYDAIKAAGYTGVKQRSLISYNDCTSHPATFKQIATAIRVCPEAVFTNHETNK